MIIVSCFYLSKINSNENTIKENYRRFKEFIKNNLILASIFLFLISIVIFLLADRSIEKQMNKDELGNINVFLKSIVKDFLNPSEKKEGLNPLENLIEEKRNILYQPRKVYLNPFLYFILFSQDFFFSLLLDNKKLL